MEKQSIKAEKCREKSAVKSNILDGVVGNLRSHKFCILKNLIPAEEVRGSLAELQTLYAIPGKFTPGQLNDTANAPNASTVRGDKVLMLSGNANETPNLSILKNKLNKLAVAIFSAHSIKTNKVSQSKIMASCYEGGGACFKRHIDRPSDGTMKLSFVFYLNPGVTEQDGGCLRIFANSKHFDVTPELGTLVIFHSDSITHEVLPCYSKRFAFTIWYKEVSESTATAAAGSAATRTGV